MKLSFCLFAFASAGMYLPKGITAQPISDGVLVQPPVFASSGGSLDTKLSLVKGNHSTIAATAFTTRLFNGTLPGPTMRLSAGEYLRIDYANELMGEEGTNDVPNDFSVPDNTNLHFHGLHVSVKLPSDDTELGILPQESYKYEVFLPKYHGGGTFWIHPHLHRSTTLQIGGGAALALIVNDEPGTVPAEVESAKDILLFVQPIDLEKLIDEAQVTSKSSLVNIDPLDEVGRDFRLVNGQYLPTLDIEMGKWNRLRVVFASAEKKPLDLSMKSMEGDCEMNLLAKDGIYIQDYPRPLTFYPIPTAGRADIMVRCNATGTFEVVHYGEKPLMNIRSSQTTDEENVAVTKNFQFSRFSYTTDLRESLATPGCKCAILLDDDKINGQSYEKGKYVHTIAQGSIVERRLSGIASHPYHQHTYPMQIIELGSGLAPEDADYFKIGDYHDSIAILSSSEAVIRYAATNYDGNVVVHCIRADHADMGMLSAEYIVNSDEGGECSCSARSDDPGFTFEPTAAPTVLTDAPVVSPVPTIPVEPSASPVLPTVAPIAPVIPPPTISPSFSAFTSVPTEECSDDSQYYRGKNAKHDCTWVAEDPDKRCKQAKTYKDSKKSKKGHTEDYKHCRKTCGDCDADVDEELMKVDEVLKN